ncbi:MAG: mechanosensitive ion channel family protein [Gaiellaceae bacterium]
MESDWLERLAVAAGVVLVTLVVAKVVDRTLARRLPQTPETLTRYRVIRRSAKAVIVTVGVLSALLVIPQVQAVAGTILASSAIIALVIGYAAQPTLSNFVAGVLVASVQPLRLGDHVDVGGAQGAVEEIGLTYTVIRAPEGAHYYVPNSKLASDTIRNETLTSHEHLARVSVAVPLASDLNQVRELLLEEARNALESVSEREPSITVTKLEAGHAVVAVEAWTRTADEAARLTGRLLEAAHERLRREGIFA